jgi:hypothetical protein
MEEAATNNSAHQKLQDFVEDWRSGTFYILYMVTVVFSET